MKPKPKPKSEHTYTHRDESGMLWRWDGSRPVSKLADEVMDECGYNEEPASKPTAEPKKSL